MCESGRKKAAPSIPSLCVRVRFDAALQMQSVTFPTFEDRFPIQLLSFLRLARIQDSMMLSKATLEDDKV